MSRFHTRALAIVFALLLIAVVACAPVRAQLVDENASYDRKSAVKLLEATEAGDIAGKPVTEAEELRSAALVDLRNQGKAGTEIANLVTSTFPPATRGVPVYAEKARFDGEKAWLVIEVIGKSGGALEDRRLWVLDSEGAILFSAIR